MDPPRRRIGSNRDLAAALLSRGVPLGRPVSLNHHSRRSRRNPEDGGRPVALTRAVYPPIVRASFALLVLATGAATASPAVAQSNRYRQADAPQPPPELNGGRWGEMIQVRTGPEDHVYVLHRCFKVVLGDPGVKPGHSDGLTPDCLGRWAVHPPILEFDASGRFVNSYGVGLVARPHGFTVDHEGNMWVADAGVIPGEKGSTVTKLSPEGQVLMIL